MRECMESKNLHLRLRKVAGQVNAVERMIDEDVPCEDVLIQINAAKNALHKIGQIVLEGHLRHCVRRGIENGDAENTISDFIKTLEHFSRMSKSRPRSYPPARRLREESRYLSCIGREISGCR